MPALERALNDPDEAVRAYAASSIGRLGTAALLDSLLERLRREPSIHVRAELLGARARLGAREDLALLSELLADASDDNADALLNLAQDLTEHPPPQASTEALRDAVARLADRLPRVRQHATQILALLLSNG